MINPRKYPFTFLINNFDIKLKENVKEKFLTNKNNYIIKIFNKFKNERKEKKINIIYLTVLYSIITLGILLINIGNHDILYIFIFMFSIYLFFLFKTLLENNFLFDLIFFTYKITKINKITKYLIRKNVKENKKFINYFKNFKIDIFDNTSIKTIKRIKTEYFKIINNEENKTDEEKEIILKTLFINISKNIKDTQDNKDHILNKILDNSVNKFKTLENKPKEEGILYKDIIKERIVIKIND